jgi:hypothetical protein
MCDDTVTEARTSEERIAGINSLAAALYLRKDPTMPIHPLAARLDCSAHHVTRAFNAAFGIVRNDSRAWLGFKKSSRNESTASRGRRSAMPVA